MRTHPQNPAASTALTLVFCLAGALLSASAPSLAAGVQEHPIVIESTSSELVLGAGVASTLDQPLHGAVAWIDEHTGRLAYVAHDDGDLWTLGHDSFGVEIDGVPQRVVLIAASRTQHRSLADFEDPSSSGVETDPDEQLEVSPGGRILGNQGILLEVASGDNADAYLTLPIPPDTLGEGGDHGGCAELMEEAGSPDPDRILSGPAGIAAFLPEGAQINADCQLFGDCTVTLFQAFDLYRNQASFEVRMTVSHQGAALQLRGLETDLGVSSEALKITDWFPITESAHRIRLDWWVADGDSQGGAVLRVNGRVAGQLRDLANTGHRVDEYRAGALDATPGLEVVYRLDHVARYGGAPENEVKTHVVSGFEEDWAGWEAATGAGDVRRSTEAALDGHYGLEAEVNQPGWGSFLKGDALAAPPEALVARFKFSAEDLSLDTGEFALLLVGYHGSASSDQSFKLTFSKPDGDLLLNAHVSDDAAASSQVLSTSLGPGEHVAELQWQKSAGPYLDNGCLRVWLEGTLLAEKCDIDIDVADLERIRLGLMNVQLANPGSLYLDSVEVTVPNS